MRRHDLDLTSAIAGLVFVALGLAFLFDATLDVRWVAPALLIGLGVAGLAAFLPRPRRDD